MGQSTGGDTYLMGALEAALGGGPDDGRVGVHAEERRRAQAVVRQVAEAMEERDDALDELDETLEQMNELREKLRVAESTASSAVKDAKADVASQREEEQRAVLSALGLAEERAVTMAAECETLREERDAIASALDFVNDEMENLRARAEAAEGALVLRREEDYRAGFAAGLMAYREELGLPAIGAIEAAAAAANAETPFEVLDANTHGGHEEDPVTSTGMSTRLLWLRLRMSLRVARTRATVSYRLPSWRAAAKGIRRRSRTRARRRSRGPSSAVR
jgi:hypothetical protein